MRSILIHSGINAAFIAILIAATRLIHLPVGSSQSLDTDILIGLGLLLLLVMIDIVKRVIRRELRR